MATYHVSSVRRILDEELTEKTTGERPYHRLEVWAVPKSKKRCEETHIVTYENARVLSAYKRGDLYRFQIYPSYVVVSVRVAAMITMDDTEVIM